MTRADKIRARTDEDDDLDWLMVKLDKAMTLLGESRGMAVEYGDHDLSGRIADLFVEVFDEPTRSR